MQTSYALLGLQRWRREKGLNYCRKMMTKSATKFHWTIDLWTSKVTCNWLSISSRAKRRILIMLRQVMMSYFINLLRTHFLLRKTLVKWIELLQEYLSNSNRAKWIKNREIRHFRPTKPITCAKILKLAITTNLATIIRPIWWRSANLNSKDPFPRSIK